jgi:DNA-binding MarR family transcriptional regulator
MPETGTSRDAALEFVATTLLLRASRVSRMLLSAGNSGISRTEAGLLSTLLDGPRRITELAGTEALAQPSVTRVVDNLAQRGLVVRTPSPLDGRVVLVEVTAAGRDALEQARAWNRSQMREMLSSLDDQQVADLASASESLGQICASLENPGPNR